MLLDKFVNSFSSMGNDAEYDDYDDSDYIVDEEPVNMKKDTTPAVNNLNPLNTPYLLLHF